MYMRLFENNYAVLNKILNTWSNMLNREIDYRVIADSVKICRFIKFKLAYWRILCIQMIRVLINPHAAGG